MGTELYENEGAGISPDDIVLMAEDWRKRHYRAPVMRGLAAKQFHAASALNDGKLTVMAAPDVVYFEDLVRETIAGILVHKVPETKFASGELITIQEGGNPGAESFGWDELSATGEPAKTALKADGAKDISTIGLSASRNKQSVETTMRAFEYTLGDLERMSMQGSFDLVRTKSAMVKRQGAFDIDEFIGAGVPGVWPSIYAYPGCLMLSVTNGSWSGATSVNIHKDVTQAFAYMRSQTQGVLDVDTLILHPNMLDVLGIPYGPEGARSRLEVLRGTFPQLTKVTWERNCPEGQGLLYKNSPEVVAARAPLLYQFLPPEVSAASFRTIMRGRFGGLYSMQPRNLLVLKNLGT